MQPDMQQQEAGQVSYRQSGAAVWSVQAEPDRCSHQQLHVTTNLRERELVLAALFNFYKNPEITFLCKVF